MTPSIAARESLFPSGFFIAFLGILCWAPLPFGSNRPWAAALLMALVFALCASLLLWALLKGQQRVLQARLRSLWWPLTLLACVPLWAGFQSITLPGNGLQWLSPLAGSLHASAEAMPGAALGSISLEPGRSAFMALSSLSLLCVFLLTVLLFDSSERIRTGFTVIAVCGVFQALYGSFMVLTGLEWGFLMEKEAYRGVATGTFVNRNHLAGYLELSLAVGVGLLVGTLSSGAERLRWRQRLRNALDTLLGPKMRLRIFLALMVIGLVLTRSRMGNTAFFIALPLAGMAYMLLQRRLSKGAILLFASLLLVDFLIVGQWFGFQELADRLQSTTAQAETRDEVVLDGLAMLKDLGVAGSGLGTFYSTYPMYKDSDVFGYYDHAHNDYLQILLELGWLGVWPLVLLVLGSLVMSVKVLIQRRTQLALGVAVASLMGVTSLLIHSVVDFNLQIPANAQLFVLVLALAFVADTLTSERKQRRRSARRQ